MYYLRLAFKTDGVFPDSPFPMFRCHQITYFYLRMEVIMLPRAGEARRGLEASLTTLY